MVWPAVVSSSDIEKVKPHSDSIATRYISPMARLFPVPRPQAYQHRPQGHC